MTRYVAVWEKLVIALGPWELGSDDITRAADPAEAVRLALSFVADL